MTTKENTMTEHHLGHDILCTAYEGGIGYWALAVKVDREQLTGSGAMIDFEEYTAVDLIEWEDEAERRGLVTLWSMDALDDAFNNDPDSFTVHTVTADALRDLYMKAVTFDPELVKALGARRLARWAADYHESPQDALCNFDAEDADVLLQVLVFGEIVYG